VSRDGDALFACSDNETVCREMSLKIALHPATLQVARADAMIDVSVRRQA
jgi:hypothetical protein